MQKHYQKCDFRAILLLARKHEEEHHRETNM